MFLGSPRKGQDSRNLPQGCVSVQASFEGGCPSPQQASAGLSIHRLVNAMQKTPFGTEAIQPHRTTGTTPLRRIQVKARLNDYQG